MEETRNAPCSNGEDRISRLPDTLIHRIISFLDTKYAVQTCILSKRWIDIWKSLSILKFSRSSFSKDKTHSFVMFVDMVFIFRQALDIQRFIVLWEESANDHTVTMNVNRWSLAAVKYNVQDVIIAIGQCHNSAYEIPHRPLNCKSLRRLGMVVLGDGGYAEIILPRSMSLPRLKVLSLTGLSISNVDSSKRLFSSCPALETLNIFDCDIQTDNQRNMIVDSLSLKKFGYGHRCRDLMPQNDTVVNIIKLCAPNLEIFSCKSFMTQDYSLENCSPLSRVDFCMKLFNVKEYENAAIYSKVSSNEKDVYARRLMKFLTAVYMVKEMRLSSGFLEVLSRAPDLLDCQPPTLCNVQYLMLEMWSTRGCLRGIAYLLKISPNITNILLESKESNSADVGNDWEARLSLPGMLSHLKFIQIEEVEGSDAELKLLSFLLKNTKVLEKVAISFRSTVGATQVKQFKDKLRAVHTASSSIQTVFKT